MTTLIHRTIDGPSYRRTYMPASYHIAQELQKYNIPDYRPRQEQYVPLLDANSTYSRYLCLHKGFKRLLRKCVLYNACEGTADLRSARRRIPLDHKTKHASLGHTTHLNQTHDHQDTKIFLHPALRFDRYGSFSLFSLQLTV